MRYFARFVALAEISSQTRPRWLLVKLKQLEVLHLLKHRRHLTEPVLVMDAVVVSSSCYYVGGNLRLVGQR